MTLHVIVPCWRELEPEMAIETGCKYAIFIPLGGKPLYKHIVEQYARAENPPQITFILSENAPPIDVNCPQGGVVKALRIVNSNSIGETVYAGLEDVAQGDAVVVQMADTLVQMDRPVELDRVFIQQRSDLYRWTSVVEDLEGQVRILHDRSNFKPVIEPQAVCVGLFTFQDGLQLQASLKDALKSKKNTLDSFFMAVESYSALHPMRLISNSSWFDCGHVDTYYESRLSFQNLRHFNSLSYDSIRGQITKRSVMVDRFRHQVRWFKQVPDSLAAFLPRIFDSDDGDDPFITMELLSIPTLGELFVSQRLNLGAWNGVVRTISFILSEFSASSYPTVLGRQLSQNMYVDKTKARLAEFIQQDSQALNYWVQVGDQVWSVRRVLDCIDEFSNDNELLTQDQLCPIHGDFCFSNLLYDPRVCLVKMIDPRGEFGVPGIYGNQLYDLAKLAHSFDGGYDFIVSDLFSIQIDTSGEIRLKTRMEEYHCCVRSIFEAMLLHDEKLKRQVYAIEALLFLSMLPLHVDAPQRQLAMLATGLRLFAMNSMATRI